MTGTITPPTGASAGAQAGCQAIQERCGLGSRLVHRSGDLVPVGTQDSGLVIHRSSVYRFSAAEVAELDGEGRCVITDHGALIIFNLVSLLVLYKRLHLLTTAGEHGRGRVGATRQPVSRYIVDVFACDEVADPNGAPVLHGHCAVR